MEGSEQIQPDEPRKEFIDMTELDIAEKLEVFREKIKARHIVESAASEAKKYDVVRGGSTHPKGAGVAELTDLAWENFPELIEIVDKGDLVLAGKYTDDEIQEIIFGFIDERWDLIETTRLLKMISSYAAEKAKVIRKKNSEQSIQ